MAWLGDNKNVAKLLGDIYMCYIYYYGLLVVLVTAQVVAQLVGWLTGVLVTAGNYLGCE